jgi:hypothetical protein
VDFDMAEEAKIVRINELIAAAGYPNSFVQFEDFPLGTDGKTDWIGRDPYARVARRLSDPEAEATALHEVAHWQLGHEDDPAYVEAIAKDAAARTDVHRAPWERAANSRGRELIRELADRMSDPEASIRSLIADDSHYPDP